MKAKATLIMPMQSVGRCGKSTISSAILEYLNFAGVEDIFGLDADGVHATFKKWYGVDLMPFAKVDDFNPIYDSIQAAGVTLIDMPAQATDQILGAFEKYQMERTLSDKGIQLVVPVFMQDDLTSQQSAMKVRRAIPYAKFILIGCAKYPYSTFTGSDKLMEVFKGAPVVEVPAMSDYALEEYTKLKKKERKELSFLQAAKLAKGASSMEFTYFRDRLFTQLEDSVKLWFHDPKLIKNKVVRAMEKVADDFDEFDL